MSYRDLPLRYYDAESLKNRTLGRFRGSILKPYYSHYFRHRGTDITLTAKAATRQVPGNLAAVLGPEPIEKLSESCPTVLFAPGLLCCGGLRLE